MEFVCTINGFRVFHRWNMPIQPVESGEAAGREGLPDRMGTNKRPDVFERTSGRFVFST